MLSLVDQNATKVLLFLAISPGSKYTRKEIKEKTGMNNVPLDQSLNMLSNLKLIEEKERLYSLNLENFFVKSTLNELKERFSNLPLKIQFILLEFISNVLKLKGINRIILFGSYAKLIYSEKSDIDIAIILDERTKEKGLVEKKISIIAEKLSKKHEKSIQVHFFTESDLKHKEDPLIKDILRGRILV